MSGSCIFESCVRLGADCHLDVIEVSGSDAEDFLQRLVSCDLKRVVPGSGTRGTLLDGKGRILAFFDAHRDSSGRFLLVVEEAMSTELRSRLDRLVILEDVEIETNHFGVISVQGPTSPQVVESLTSLDPDTFLQSVCWRNGLVIARPRSPQSGYDLLLPQELIPEIEQQLEQSGVTICSAGNAERARIEAGFPRLGQEVTERSLPPEVGLSDAISYDKGCYAGQEVLARIRTYGHVNRQLRRLEMVLPEAVSSSPMMVGDVLHANEGDVKPPGKITSVASDGRVISLLASVRKTHIDEGTLLRWEGTAEDGSSLVLSGAVNFPFRP
ncbi:MAG: hypothetical protein AAEJ04_05630 [Planctomycetota bacterium]